MPNYRRYRVPGGTYFFTINLLERRSDLLIRHVDALRDAVRRARRERPFRIDAWVVLPGHMRCVVTPPEGDDSSNRLHERPVQPDLLRIDASIGTPRTEVCTRRRRTP